MTLKITNSKKTKSNAYIDRPLAVLILWVLVGEADENKKDKVQLS